MANRPEVRILSTPTPARRGRIRGRRAKPPMAATLAALALGACTTIHVRDGSAVRTTYYPGVAVVRVEPGNAMQIVDVQALGPAIVGDQASLGWVNAQIALLPEGRCQLLMWEAGEETVSELRNLFGAGTELCTQEGEIR